MKKRVFLVVYCLCSIWLFPQADFSISGKAKTTIRPSISAVIDPGTRVKLIKFYSMSTTPPKYGFLVECGGKRTTWDSANVKDIEYDPPTTNEELWQIIAVKSDLYTNFASKGLQYDLRSDLEEETLSMLSNYQKYDWFFDDKYVEDYIQSLLYKVHAITLKDGRPGNLVVKIIKNSIPNAFSTPTGAIIITTGLLSTIRSEDELIGILAHESAHFVLDHQIVNINKANDRKKRAEFWASFATTLAAATEVYLAAKKHIYTGGAVTLATAVLSTGIADSVLENLGAKFDRGQEFEADAAATKTLEFLKRDPKALSAALSRIQNYDTLTGNYLALSPSGDHPALSSRIAEIGEIDPAQFNNKNYDQLISFVNTYNAEEEYRLKHLETTLQLVNRNLEAGVATEEDYLLKGMVLRALYDTPDHNREALDFIVKARSININPDCYPQIYKEEGITLLRLGRKSDAVVAFQTYVQKLDALKEKPQYILDEIIWTRKMIYKANAN